MVQSLVVNVAPCGRSTRRGGGAKGQRLSAPGCKEFAIGQAVQPVAPQQLRQAAPCKIDQTAPYCQEPKKQNVPEMAYDDDGEAYVLCPECRLPVGDLGYTADDGEGRMLHGECQAQRLLRDAKRQEEARLRKVSTAKKTQRAQYDLGWKVDRVPRNSLAATKLQCGPFLNGMCGIAWQEDSKTISIVPTMDQSASVNLEYLAIALQVRIKEGKEPMFSLDPKDLCPQTAEKDLWQVKSFEPRWLAGTSVGEVMFQADYHLKELSLGDGAQPVAGMKNCYELSKEEGFEKEWIGREWFVVKKAEIQMTEDNVMIPRVKLGIEAREISKGTDGYEDVPITRHDHPLVKYAESFSHYFDLIAERKSAIYHLRELAKATCLAKFMVENEARLDHSWMSFEGTEQPFSAKEVPQLWNEHRAAQVHVANGQIMAPEGGLSTQMHAVYGGLDLTMAPGRVAGRAPPAKVTAARVPTLTARMISARGAVPEFAVGAPGVPKGVDLALDNFDLSVATEAAAEKPAANWTGKDFLGSAFWSSMSELAEEDRSLLQDVFKPSLSDRRDDGEFFVPPSTSLEHVAALRRLVEEEAALQQQRKNHFISAEFEMDAPGHLFPASWAAPVRCQRSAALHPRPDYKADATRILKTVTPAFDRTAEDGIRFRVYKAGSVEVRTMQALGAEELAVAAFSASPAAHTAGDDSGAIVDSDRVVKATEFVEQAAGGARHFYVVLETSHGDQIVTEKLADRTVTWAENPAELEYRNSQAKVIRSVDCDTTVQHMKAHQSRAEHEGPSKRYAHDAFLRTVPGRQKGWAVLAEHERLAAEELGASGEAAWDQGAAEVWNRSWEALGDIRQEAAIALGYSEALWPSTLEKQAPVAEEDKPVEELSQAEQERIMALWVQKQYGIEVNMED
eukprot:CAMPEP_0171175192 /NCGR_PEP_ID=MMETSP0790-20130122/11106_1 /TAXON_ID=2925 /ORGANISM="Alexandrium catenella, Strain OF101" /LENGTH=904 /DNA_ID=CAMNT_0011640069 /DNA_START=53 /DNA_END=2767 /DNA_ORIENTATION=-